MKRDVTRRRTVGLGLAAAGFALTACARPAGAKPPATKPLENKTAKPAAALPPTPAEHAIVPLPFDASKLDGLSARLLTLHHGKNYAGAVSKLNAIRAHLQSADASKAGSYWSEYGTLKAGEAAARNSALLHELYFANLIGPGHQPPAGIAKALADRYGSVEAAVAQMKGCGKSAGGWVVLAFDASSNTIEIVATDDHRGGAWNAEALIVLDVFEHSYAIDYGPDRDAYLDAFFRNLHWAEIGRRFDVAVAR